jgi:hypothetical protein
LAFWSAYRVLVGVGASSGGWRLVEAADAEELTRAVIEAQSWPWPDGKPRKRSGT